MAVVWPLVHKKLIYIIPVEVHNKLYLYYVNRGVREKWEKTKLIFGKKMNPKKIYFCNFFRKSYVKGGVLIRCWKLKMEKCVVFFTGMEF